MPERTFQVSECEGHCYMFNVIYKHQKERFSVSESKRRYIRQDGESPNPPTILYLTIPAAPYHRNMCNRKDLGMDHGRIDGDSLLLHYFALSLIPVYPPGRCSPWSTLTEAFPPCIIPPRTDKTTRR